ncbi:kelch-like protein 4 [Paramacrobiotus metropolitanus]|uniref:kelch-like protein 4 n=1 Tax=Paramacrobiotus metropolitanus TaxID=2943436 RepID=UPI0024457409|nr:kelch-like protein 4 [Paramacrobiotus metropolitanus]
MNLAAFSAVSGQWPGRATLSGRQLRLFSNRRNCRVPSHDSHLSHLADFLFCILQLQFRIVRLPLFQYKLLILNTKSKFCNYPVKAVRCGNMSQPSSSAEGSPHRHGCLAEEFLRGLHELQSTGTLCDVLLQGSDATVASLGIPCHRNVLTAHCGYFRSLFTHDWKESAQRELQLQNMDTRTLNEVVQFMYTLDLRLSESNVERILAAAQFLQMGRVAAMCWEYLQRRLNLSTCLQVHALASDLHNPRLADAALAIIHPQFLRLAQRQEFLRMEAHQYNLRKPKRIQAREKKKIGETGRAVGVG